MVVRYTARPTVERLTSEKMLAYVSTLQHSHCLDELALSRSVGHLSCCVDRQLF
jgi:hypothetical protein